jgi:hypothetical protein
MLEQLPEPIAVIGVFEKSQQREVSVGQVTVHLGTAGFLILIIIIIVVVVGFLSAVLVVVVILGGIIARGGVPLARFSIQILVFSDAPTLIVQVHVLAAGRSESQVS